MLYGYGELVIQGTLTTVALAVLSIICATLIGIVGAVAKTSGIRALRIVVSLYSTFIRGIPPLVLMLLIFYNIQNLINWVLALVGHPPMIVNAFTAGVITLAFIYGSYMTETFRGAFEAVPVGQIEAAQSTGMNNWQVFKIVTLRQMVRYALPSYTNNMLVLTKGTALVSIIGLVDIVQVTQQAGRGSQHIFLFNLVAAAIYLAFTSLLLAVLSFVKRRANVGVKEASL